MQTAPALRQDVAALRAPAGWLFQDPRRWQLISAPARLEGQALAEWLAKRRLGPDEPLPEVRWRTAQHFRVPPEWLPSSELVAPAGARFTCAACSASCRTTELGPLPLADVELLLGLPWGEAHPPDQLFTESWGEPLTAAGARTGERDVFLRKVGGGCRFLRADGLCSVHASFGVEKKPVMCRLFPFAFLATPAGVRLQVRFSDCLSADRALGGQPVTEQLGELAGLLRASATVRLVPPLLWLSPGRLVRWSELEAAIARLLALPPASPREAAGAPGLAAACYLELRRWAGGPPAASADHALLDALVQAGLDEADPAGPSGRSRLPLLAAAAAAAPRAPATAALLLPLDDAALALEQQLVAAELWSLQLLEAADLLKGAAMVLTRAALGRRIAAGLAARAGLGTVGPRQLLDGQISLVRRHLREVGGETPPESFAEACLLGAAGRRV